MTSGRIQHRNVECAFAHGNPASQTLHFAKKARMPGFVRDSAHSGTGNFRPLRSQDHELRETINRGRHVGNLPLTNLRGIEAYYRLLSPPKAVAFLAFFLASDFVFFIPCRETITSVHLCVSSHWFPREFYFC